MTLRTHLPLATRDLLGESPVWDAQAGALSWVDSRGRQVHRLEAGVLAASATHTSSSTAPSSSSTAPFPSSPAKAGDPATPSAPLRSWSTPQDIGSIALAGPGRLLLALQDQFAFLDLASGAVSTVAPVDHPRPPMRLNDGRTDREGRYVCGSMVLHRSDVEGRLYRLEHDGRVTLLLDNAAAVANATCFSPDGRTLYFADSLAGVIRAWDYAPDGALSNARVLVDTRPQGSGPDGATVDAEGCLWVALVLAAKVARYAPDGRLLRVVDLPVPYPTCPCFGGPQLDTLYVTSLRDSGHRLRSEDPAAGALVEVTGLGVRGLPEVPYRHAP